MGLPDNSVLSKELVYTLCCFASLEEIDIFHSSELMHAQGLRMVLLPIIFGEFLTACSASSCTSTPVDVVTILIKELESLCHQRAAFFYPNMHHKLLWNEFL